MKKRIKGVKFSRTTPRKTIYKDSWAKEFEKQMKEEWKEKKSKKDPKT